MPELPEVETTRAGIAPHIVNQELLSCSIHESRMRWPVPSQLGALEGELVESVIRRGKYLLISLETTWLLIHLGMSGSLRLVSHETPRKKHDHVEFYFEDWILRFHDPRRFGCVLMTSDWENHPLIKDMGPEPLSLDFDGDYLYKRARGRKTSIKQFVMNGNIVVGVGNIYANEALFMSGISPKRAAGNISLKRMQLLSENIKLVLERSIKQGGTTLRDFVSSDGSPGYFKQQLFVYGKAGLDCQICGTTLKEVRQNNRSTVYCPSCQS